MPDELGALAPVLTRAGELDAEARLDAAGLARGLVDAAGALSRPAPLPLVGPSGETEVSLDGRDATLLGPGSRVAVANGSSNGNGTPGGVAAAAAAAAVAGADGGDDQGGSGSGLALADPRAAHVGAETTHLALPVSPPAVRPPANGVHTHDGPVPPWATGHHEGMSPNDRSARRLMLGAAVVVVAVAVGIVGGWLYMQSQIPSHVVPASLVGMQRDALPGVIDEFGWEISDETTRRDGTQPGQILETDPAAGEELREGDTLTVLVSQGPTLVDLPEGLAGMTADDATAALEAVGLGAEVVLQPSDDVPEGIVIGVAGDEAADQAPRGSTVPLAVSSGTEFAMPDVTGRPYAEAVADLEGAGLEVEVEDDSDDDTDPGSVIRTDPEAGDQVEPGDRVTVVVDVDDVEVPRLRGDSLEEATEELEQQGLTVGEVTGPTDGRVLGTWPLEGTEVTSGTPVSLVMRPRR